jgi:hypothetical protein
MRRREILEYEQVLQHARILGRANRERKQAQAYQAGERLVYRDDEVKLPPNNRTGE